MWYKCRIILLVSVVLTVLATSPLAQTEKTAPSQDVKTVEIDAVINAIGEALKEAQGNNVPDFPPLKSVEITLSTVASKEAGAKFKILVFSIGGGISGEDVSTIKFKMEPPTTKSAKTAAVNPERYKMALASSLNVAKAGVLSANQKLKLVKTSEVEIEVAFTVKQQGDGGISLEPLGLGETAASLGVNGKVSRSQVHKLKLAFGTGSK